MVSNFKLIEEKIKIKLYLFVKSMKKLNGFVSYFKMYVVRLTDVSKTAHNHSLICHPVTTSYSKIFYAI